MGLKAILLGMCVLVSHALAAQEVGWRQLSRQVAQLYQEGRYEEAVPLGEQALRGALADLGPINGTVASLANNLAELYRVTGKYAEAESLYRKALSVNAVVFGPENAEAAKYLGNLGELFRLEKNYDEAEKYHKQALAMEAKVSGKNDPDYAIELNDLAFLYKETQHYDDAEPLFKQALEIAQKVRQPDDPVIATTMENLGGLYRDQRKYADAETLYKQAMSINQAALGPESWKVAADLTQLGNLNRLQQHFPEAETDYRRALEMDEKALGADNPRVADIKNDLGNLYGQTKRYSDAEALYKQALAIDEKTIGSKDSDILTPVENLAGMYRFQGRSSDAERLYKEILAGHEIALGPTHPQVAVVLNDFANFYGAEGRYGDAARVLDQAVKILEERRGQDDPQIALLLNNRAKLLEKQGNFPEAEPLLERALKIEELHSDRDNASMVAGSLRLAQLYQGEGKFAQAEPLFKRVLEGDEKTKGQENPLITADLNRLALLYTQEARYQDAELLHNRARTIDEKAFGPDSPRVAAHLENLAFLYMQEQKYADSEALHKRALAIDEKALGPDSPAVSTELSNLAWLYHGLNRDAEAEELLNRVMAIDEKHASDVRPEDRAATLGNLAELYRDHGRYNDAEDLYKRALAMHQKVAGPENPLVVPVLANLALLHWDSGNPDKAQEYFSQSQSLFLRLLDQQFTFMSETERLGYLKSISFEFPLYFSFVYNYRAQHPDLIGRAYNVLLWEKGMVASSVRDQRRAIEASGDSEAIALLDRLTSKKSQLAALERTPPDSAESSPTSIDALRNETEELEKQLTKKSSAFAEATRLSRPNWMEVQRTLRSDDAAIEFLRFPVFDGKKWTSKSKYVAFVLRSNDTAPIFVDLGDAGIPGAAEGLEGAPMEDYRRRVLMKSEAADDFGKEFYRAFWKPLEPLLKGVRRIYISPDGALYQVSWAAIPRDDGRPLTDSCEIDIVVSTKDILRSRQQASTKSVVLIGNPQFNLDEDEHKRAVAALQAKSQSNVSCSDTSTATTAPPASTTDSPNALGSGLDLLTATQAEIESLSGLFKKNGWTVESYCRSKALEEVVKHARHPRVLHMATHGFFEPDPPTATPQSERRPSTTVEYPMLRSGLYFAGADRALGGSSSTAGVDTGIFTAYEATNLDLFGTELVVLSACETGLGKVENGEGIFGLRRAFQEAGAESVLMSMWSVPDRETKQFMTLFYEKWLSGMEKHRALSGAQAALREELRKEWKIDPPHYWAAFVLVGP